MTTQQSLLNTMISLMLISTVLAGFLDDADMVAIENSVPRKAMENLPRYGGGLGERVFTKEINISLFEWKE